MEKMSKYDEFIQPFLDGELSREELDWFSKELESNAVLAEDIRLYREVDNAIREQDVMDLRDQLDVIHNSIGDPSQEQFRQPRYRKVLSYAAIASLAILISLGVLFLCGVIPSTVEESIKNCHPERSPPQADAVEGCGLRT